MTRKLALAATVFVAALVALPAIAGAHVEITPEGTVSADGTISTSVFAENECKNELKTVELVFPATPELTVATPTAVADWTVAVSRKPGSEVVTGVTWSNTSGTGDGEFGIALGPIPTDAGPLEFKAIQTCDDGEVFRWVQKGESSEFPAPVLALASADGTSSTTDGTSSTTNVPVTTKAKSSDSNTAIIIGIVAASLLLIGAGVVLFKRNSTKK